MAIIDTFLKLLVAQKAERLVLAPDEVPTLFKAEESIPLSMPAVPADLARRLAVEVVGAERSDGLTGDQPLEGTYRSDDGDEFTYRVSSNGEGCRIEMHSLAFDDASEEASGGSPAPAPRLERAAASESPPDVPVAGAAASQLDPAVLSFLEHAVNAGASDIFLSSGKPAQMRLGGVITSLETAITTDAGILQMIPREENRSELDRSGSVDFAAQWELSGKNRRFRVNVFRHSGGLAAALRPIHQRIPSLEELHLPDDLLRLCSYSSGLVLLAGASGSGKSTTLAAMVEHLNRTKPRHVITIEDPIEFEHRDDMCLIHQREVGSNVESFSSGLRAALRENPDVILLGEMRDLPTVAAALTAAETGHLVLSTLHTGSASAAVNRIIDVFPGHQQSHVRIQLASSLRAVVAQRLIPTVEKSGRIPALEKLIVTPAVANAIRDGHEHHMRSAMQTGAADGMITLERSLAALVRDGRISRSNALRHADDEEALRKLLG